MDRKPRELSSVQAETLRILGRQVMSQLELRRQTGELAESERRLQIVTNNARVGLVILNKDRRYIYANTAYAQILNLAPSGVVGRTVAELLPHLYEEQIRPHLDRAFAGSCEAYELRKPGPDGDAFYAVQYQPTKVDGVVTLVVVVITEITERKRAEEKLGHAEQFAKSTIDALSAHLCVLDERGTILATNEAWRAFTLANPPLARRVQVGDNYLQVCDTATGPESKDAASFAAGIRATISSDRTEFSMEYPCHSPVEQRWFIGRVTRFPSGNGIRLVVAHENITERKLAEIASNRLATIVEFSDDAIISKDLNSIITSWNRGAEKIFGYAASQIVGTSIMRLIPADRHAEEDHILSEIKQGRSVEHFETRRLTRDGREIDVSITASPMKDATGTVIGVSKVARDITERKKVEAARKASEERYRTLFENAPDGIVIADSQSHYLDGNASICRMLGYTREEFIGLHASNIVVPEEVKNIAPALISIKAKSDYHKEWQFRRKDGSTFPAEVIATLMPDGNLMGMIRDITERKRTEGRFRRLVDSNAQGVMFWNVKGEITGANDAFLRTVGYTREDLEAGRLQWGALSPPEYATDDLQRYEEIATRGVCGPFERDYLRKDGTRVPVLVGAAAFEDNPQEGFSFVVDLTERKKLEAKFLRAQRMESIGTLAGGIAHDLNNVLAPIMMSVEMLKDLARNEQDLKLLDLLLGSSRRASELVKQVLSFARGMEGQRITVNPLPLIRDLLAVMRDTFPKSIDVRFNAARNLWTVTGDPTQIHQVFLNLCVNARDAMPSGGSLSISMENIVLDETYAAMNPDSRPGAYVMVKVDDNGMGIPRNVQDKIFEPFFTTKEIGKGTGLGLSTTLTIVKSHGGFINLYSEVGQGTTFKVYLPANTTKAASDEVEVEQTRLPRGHGELILVVDDEKSIREIAQRTLERFGYRVLLAINGAEAIALYAQHRAEIALVLTDMAMPVMDGPATIIALKMMNPAVKIIGSSGLASNGGVAQAVTQGVQHFVPKPYTAETMLKTIQRVLHGQNDAPDKSNFPTGRKD